MRGGLETARQYYELSLEQCLDKFAFEEQMAFGWYPSQQMLEQNIAMIATRKEYRHGVCRIPADRLFHPIEREYDESATPSPTTKPTSKERWGMLLPSMVPERLLPIIGKRQPERSGSFMGATREAKKTTSRLVAYLNKDLPLIPPPSPELRRWPLTKKWDKTSLGHAQHMPRLDEHPPARSFERQSICTMSTLPEELQVKVPDPVRSPTAARRLKPRDAQVRADSVRELAQFFKYAGPGEGKQVTVDQVYIAKLLKRASRNKQSPMSMGVSETDTIDHAEDTESLHEASQMRGSSSLTSTAIFRLGSRA